MDTALKLLCLLVVAAYASADTIPPEIKEGPGNVTKVHGSEVVMRCRVLGSPKPIVKWMRNNVELIGGNFNITTEGDLVIRRAGFGDAGLYRCVALNSVGEKSAYGYLKVKKPSAKIEPQRQEAEVRTYAEFLCTPDIDPRLSVEVFWKFKGQTIDFKSHSRFRMTKDYKLVIYDIVDQDTGSYECIVKTLAYEVRDEAVLTVQDRPNAPVLLGMECKEKVANLVWKPMGDNRAPILRYSIQYNTTFTPDTWDSANDNVPAIETSWTLELTPWANYTFRVVAHNKIGPSGPSGHSEVCTTQPDVPYKNPDNVKSYYGHGLNGIYWSPMPQIEHNGPGFYYQVSFKRNDTGEHWTHMELKNGRQDTLILNTAGYGVITKIKIVAWNSEGPSNVAPVEILGGYYFGPLLEPTNLTLLRVISGNEALVSWNPLPPDSGYVEGYRIQSWTDGQEDQIQEIEAKPDATEIVINTLKPNQKNYVRIMVYNGFNNGPPSNTLSFDIVTPESKLGPAHSLSAFPIGSSAMLLTWYKPMDENNSFIGYKVYYSKIVGTQIMPWVEGKNIIDSQLECAKIVGLLPDTTYRIELRAMTKNGEVELFFVEQATRSEYIKQPNRSPGVHMLVRWRPALDGQPSMYFQTSYRMMGQNYPQWEQWQMEEDDDYVLVKGLAPNWEFMYC